LLHAPGNYHGRFTHHVPGGPSWPFHATIYSLRDSGLAIVDFDSSAGPAAVLSVIPATWRASLRPEFAFEFVSFWHFSAGHRVPGADMAIHDYIENLLRAAEPHRSLAFSIESEPGDSEASVVLAACIEDLVSAMHRWLVAGRVEPQIESKACA